MGAQGRAPAQPASPAQHRGPTRHTAGPAPGTAGPARSPAAVPRPGRAPAATHRLTTPVLILICLRRGSAMAAGAVTAQPRAAHAPNPQPGQHHRSGREPRVSPCPAQWRGPGSGAALSGRSRPRPAGPVRTRGGRNVGGQALLRQHRSVP